MVNIKSQSGIIGAVLLILIVIISAMVVMAFAIPFVKERLGGGGGLEVAGEITIKNSLQYTCYNATQKNMSVQIHYGDIQNLTKGFQINVGVSGSSLSYVIPDDATVVMYDGSTLEIPGANLESTYVLSGVPSLPEYVEVYPILVNGDVCDKSDSLTSVSKCSSPF